MLPMLEAMARHMPASRLRHHHIRRAVNGRVTIAAAFCYACIRKWAEADMPENAKIEALRAALIEGERSGVSTPFDFDEFIVRKRRGKKVGHATTRAEPK
jgi:hypothetical protein